MERQVSFVVELAVKKGSFGAFKDLIAEMVAGTNIEPQTLAYEWYVSEDTGTVYIFEKYADSEAMITHVGGFMKIWAERFLNFVDVKSFTVLGDPSPAARDLLTGLGPVYLRPLAGFSRLV